MTNVNLNFKNPSSIKKPMAWNSIITPPPPQLRNRATTGFRVSVLGDGMDTDRGGGGVI